MEGFPRDDIQTKNKEQLRKKQLVRIEDDISDDWVEDWAKAGVAEMGEYLAKHAAFQSFLDAHDAMPKIVPVNEERAA